MPVGAAARRNDVHEWWYHPALEQLTDFVVVMDAADGTILYVNRFVEEQAGEEIELHRLDPEAEERQVERTARVRAERDGSVVEGALTRVREAARGTENLLPPMREALAAHCTVGEICNALREEFGTYDAHNAP